MPPYPPLHTLPYSSSHFPAPITLRTISAIPTYLSQIPVINKCSTSSPSPLPHITHLSSIIILHLFLTSNNPAEPVFSLKSSLTTSWPCTDLKYLSIPAPFFANLLLQCIAAYFLLPVLLISPLNLFLPAMHWAVHSTQLIHPPQNLILFSPAESSILS